MRKLFGLFIGILLVGSCASIDCPVENLVLAHYKFYDSFGDSLIIVDTLTVTTRRSDNSNETLLNDMTEKSSFLVPMSYFHPEDILALDFRYGKVHFYDTLWVKKEDIPHFESIDCNAKYFHRLTSVRNTTHYIICGFQQCDSSYLRLYVVCYLACCYWQLLRQPRLR